MRYFLFLILFLITGVVAAETEEQAKQRYCRRMAELVQNQDPNRPNVYAREYLTKYCQRK